MSGVFKQECSPFGQTKATEERKDVSGSARGNGAA